MLQLRTAAVERQRLRLGRRHLGAHPRHVELGDVAGVEAPLDQAQRVAVGRDGVAHQRAFLVEGAQRQVGLRHVGLHQQAGALQQRLAGPRVQCGGTAGAGQAAEQVDLVAEVGAGADQRAGARAGAGLGAARDAGTDTDLRGAVGVGGTHQRARLRQPRRGGLDAVVGLAGALHQLVERGIGEGLPPRAARLCVGRGGGGPAAVALLEGHGRDRQRRGIDGGRGGAAGQHQGCEQRGQHGPRKPLQAAGEGWRRRKKLHDVLCSEGGKCSGPLLQSWWATGAAGSGFRFAPPVPGVPAKASACGTSPCCVSGRLPARRRSST